MSLKFKRWTINLVLLISREFELFNWYEIKIGNLYKVQFIFYIR